MLILTGLALLLYLSGCASLGPLSQAAADNDIEKIKTLVAEGTDVNELDKTAYMHHTALWRAVDTRNHEAVKTLLELGADPNIYSSDYGINKNGNYYGYGTRGEYRFNGSPLMAAVLEEDKITVEMLLKAGADPNAMAEEAPIASCPGMDPLGYGAMTGNVAVATLLLNYGADANVKYPNNVKAAYEAINRGYIDYAVLLIENGFEIESDPEYMHYNAELAHLAADHYASSDAEKAIQLYKQAIELYPGGAKNYESIADGEGAKEVGMMMVAAFGTVFNQYAASQGISSSGSFTVPGAKYAYYRIYNYDPNWTKEEYFREKAKQSLESQTHCQEIVDCYEENKPKVALADCVKETYQKEEETLPSR